MARHLACVIGWPVAHSLSPAIHNAAFAATGLDWTYVALAVHPDGAADGIALLRAMEVDGANVTMPHKRTVIPHLDGLEGDAVVLDAVNTIVRDGDGLVGHNTDAEGFVRFLRADAGVDPAGLDVLVLGAGGAARAVAVGLARARSRVAVAARREAQAREVAALAGGIEVARWEAPPPSGLVVNATPAREGLPTISFEPGTVAVDLIYAPPETAFVARARAAGANAHGGIGMLIHQAALSFELWTGGDAPLEAMRTAALAALSEASASAAGAGDQGPAPT